MILQSNILQCKMGFGKLHRRALLNCMEVSLNIPRIGNSILSILSLWMFCSAIPAPAENSKNHGTDHSGKVLTVTGPVLPEDLGETLMHEHLFIDFWLPVNRPDRWNQLFGRKPPSTGEEIRRWREPLTMENRIEMAPQMWANRDAFTLDRPDDAVDEVQSFKALGRIRRRNPPPSLR